MSMLPCLTLGTIDGIYAYCFAIGAMTNKDRAVSRKVVAEDYLGVDGRTQVNNEDLPDFLVPCRTQYATSMIIISEKRGTFKHHLALLNDLELLLFVNGKKRPNK
mmetsp:Transcript_13910/g.16156  ORF Transcript_13910/g.16156 Transcript_13910/m.16156 type:complete len:105 (+) Transcript_13910:3-317(+)